MRPLSVAYSSASIPPARMDLANKEGFPRNNKRQRLGIHGIATHRISALDSISAGANHKEPTTKQVKPQPRWCSVTEIPKLHDYPKVICEVSDSQLKVCDVLPNSPQRVDVYVIANVRFIYTDTSTHSEIQRSVWVAQVLSMPLSVLVRGGLMWIKDEVRNSVDSRLSASSTGFFSRGGFAKDAFDGKPKASDDEWARKIAQAFGRMLWLGDHGPNAKRNKKRRRASHPAL